jgi:hypothetical protein
MTQVNANTSFTWKKSKTIAILLAVFIGPFSWLYTWRKNKSKFVAGVGVVLGSMLLILSTIVLFTIFNGFSVPNGEDAWGLLFALFYVLLFVIPLNIAVWIWAIIDQIIKKASWYKTSEMDKEPTFTKIVG